MKHFLHEIALVEEVQETHEDAVAFSQLKMHQKAKKLGLFSQQVFDIIKLMVDLCK